MVRFIVEVLLADETSLEVSGTYTVERRDKQTNRLVARMTVNGKGEAVKKSDALVLYFMKGKLTVPQTSLDVAGNSWVIVRRGSNVRSTMTTRCHPAMVGSQQLIPLTPLTVSTSHGGRFR